MSNDEPSAQDEQSAPYSSAATGSGSTEPKRIRTHHLQRFKGEGRKFTMITAYDAMIANVLDEAGVELLLCGDSAANVMQGSDSTLSITVDEHLVYAKSVVAGAKRALVVADLPFGSYQASPEQAVHTAVRYMKEAGVHAVKMEAHAGNAHHVRAVVDAGIPVMAHAGFTPQAEHQLGGFRVQGRGEQARKVIDDARALEEAGAFCILVEMIPATLMEEVEAAVQVPTIGIGAGTGSTGQVLVWQDMLGLNNGRLPRFVKKYADLRGIITEAVRNYREDVAQGIFPAEEHTF
ncbi:3-methyl-2-oxobutanoate hydroxymethyltransferase [Nesterenkonia sp. MY13]|uniref:3-methyl-2-oxobutanoate hydroxymethyltransferase n=1 Tax=Nesterenkonia sedimenti TaxID=1463632 RepID=A0A7X8TIJ4_9MICC|nr:3-methyl-2-oxobutanoate hydroxymethyltransferase [Nesterenkonia sedimenti]NLS08698.1 3-methyl-2-oxobutanoate hydroxymethyltransferase [Nesterenkonia sedimenti]